jgi:hypothetical protein
MFTPAMCIDDKEEALWMSRKMKAAVLMAPNTLEIKRCLLRSQALRMF